MVARMFLPPVGVFQLELKLLSCLVFIQSDFDVMRVDIDREDTTRVSH